MRNRLILLGGLGLALACGGQAADQAETPAAPGIALAEVAGTWTTHAMNAAGDSTLVTYDLMATSTSDGWTMTFEGRDPLPVRVTVDGDSIMGEAGPFPSMLRADVTVTTHSVLRLVNGELVGTFHGAYSDGSELNGKLHGVRKM